MEDLTWPHEAADLEMPVVPVLDRLRFCLTAAAYVARNRLFKMGFCPPPSPETLIPGLVGHPLSAKTTFSETMLNAGYTAPLQVLITPGEETAAKKVVDAFLQENELNLPILCKPTNASEGRGIVVLRSPEELSLFIGSLTEPYLVQKYLPPQKDYRYAMVRDENTTYRICYEKRRPTVTGNGKDALWKLVASDPEIPVLSKIRLFKKQLKRLLERPADGETVDLINSGNISQGAYGVLPEEAVLTEIDAFMLQVIKDVEEATNLHLPVYCFDIGLTDCESGSVSRGNVVFYEMQLPFNYTGYLLSPALAGRRFSTALRFLRVEEKIWANHLAEPSDFQQN